MSDNYNYEYCGRLNNHKYNYLRRTIFCIESKKYFSAIDDI